MMKNFNEYRNFYGNTDAGGGIPEGIPEPKTFKEWAVARLCGLAFGSPPKGLEPKTPTECYLAYAISQQRDHPGVIS